HPRSISTWRYAAIMSLTKFACWLLLALMMVKSSAAARNSPYTMNVSLEHSVLYAADRWLPVRVELTNQSATPVNGFVEITPAGEGAVYHLPVFVPAHARVTRPVAVYFPDPPETPSSEKAATPMLLAMWRGSDGERLAMTDVLGHPLHLAIANAPTDRSAAMTMMLRGQLDLETKANNIGDWTAVLMEAGGYPSAVVIKYDTEFPRELAALDGVRVIAWSGLDPSNLSQIQREVLLNWVRGGGRLVVGAPTAPEQIQSSWLAEWLPVRIVGHRLAKGIQTTDDR